MKGKKIELTDKEVAYLTKHFKHMKNAELAAIAQNPELIKDL